ncbi:Putative acyl-CoA synthetase YngI [Leucoagaricus sp. SymC.cos]|nr:Putative acyl-CoA synthetase YngI [Leucoagaricus sp. SymC.cos]
MGVKKGDRVGVIMGNNSAYAMLQWACVSIGAILVTINPAYKLHELVSTLRVVNVQHLFAVPRMRSSTYIETLSQAFPQIRSQHPGEIRIEELPELRNLIAVDNAEAEKARLGRLKIRSLVDWREILLWREDAIEERRVAEIMTSLKKDDVVNLQFTSGTTGLPKAVSLTHDNLLNNGISIGRAMWFTEQDVLCEYLFKLFFLVLGNLAAWTHGACIVYPSAVFDPPSIVDAVVEEKCTALHGVPTHFLGVSAEVEKRRAAGEVLDFGRLRTGIAAGSPIPIDLMKSLIEKLNLRDLTVAYGMTETSPVSFQSTPADPIIKRVETVGKILPHVRAKVVDADGDVVPVNTPGEIVVAGYLLQKGYWDDEKQTKEVMKKDKEGTLWMWTGDEGIMDEEGYLRIVGRIKTHLKDIIIRGGENLFPVQIENALTAHNAIREAAAVSVPDKKYGEVVGAWIVREPGTSISRVEVRASVVQNMNHQNAPAWVWFIGEDGNPTELPKTASGKVQKHILRKWSRYLADKGVGEVV